MKALVVLVEAGGGRAEAEALQWQLADAGLAVLRVKAGPSAASRSAEALRAAGAEYAVFAACGRDDGDLDELVPEAARAARLDPLNVEAVPAPHLGLARSGPKPVEAMAALLAAAVGAARDARSLPPEARHFRRLSGGMAVSRRNLLRSLVRPVARAVPTVDGERCIAKWGCRACAESCPAPGMVIADGRSVVEPNPCIGCGRCVVACPTSAVSFGPAGSEGLASRLRARDAAGLAGVAIVASPAAVEALLADGHGATLATPAFALHVPCSGAASPAVLLWAARHGIPVTAFPCPPGSPCGAGCAAGVARNVQAVQAALRAAGRDESTVQAYLWPRDGPGPWAWLERTVKGHAPRDGAALPAEGAPDGDPGSFGVEAQHLLAAYPSAATALDDPALPLGVVTVRTDACTLCGLCSGSCRPGALRQEETGDTIRLAFDAAACTACGACKEACPEDALQLTRRLDPALLRGNPADLAVQPSVRCRSCGSPLGPAAVLDVVRKRSGMASGGAWERILGLCQECRIRGLDLDAAGPGP